MRDFKEYFKTLEKDGKLEQVTVIHPKGARQFMEWIVGTTKYLSNRRMVIYDVSFLSLYNHDGRVLDGCFAVDNFLYKIDQWAHVDSPERFEEVLQSTVPESMGTCIYLDDALYMSNVTFGKRDQIVGKLLTQRNEGLRWFNVLKIIDGSKNATYFYPSKKAIVLHELMLKLDENARKKARPTPTKKEALPRV